MARLMTIYKLPWKMLTPEALPYLLPSRRNLQASLSEPSGPLVQAPTMQDCNQELAALRNRQTW